MGEIPYLVLDEADQVLAVGGEEDVEVILEKLPSTRQSMLFSATMPDWVKKLARRYLDNPLTIALVDDQEEKLAEGIKLYAIPTTATSKHGPGAFAFIQGDDRANPFWKLVHDGLNNPGKNKMLAANGRQMCRLQCPVQLLVEPSKVVQFSLGQLAVFNVPAEVTTREGSCHREDESKTVGPPEADSGGSRKPDATVINTDNFRLVHSELGDTVVCEDTEVVDATAEIDSAALSFKHEQRCCAGSRTFVLKQFDLEDKVILMGTAVLPCGASYSQ